MTKLLLFFITSNLLAQSYGNWIEIDSLQHARAGHTIVMLNNGDILVAGLDNLDSIETAKSCEIFDVVNNSWRKTASLNFERFNHNLIVLNNGEVLSFGGNNGKSCELFNPINEEWRFTDSIPTDRNFGGEAYVKLSDGKILVIGGTHYNFDGNPSNILPNCDIYNHETGKWEIAKSLNIERRSHSAILLADGRILVSGGYNHNKKGLKTCEIYNPENNSWIETDSLTIARAGHSQILLENGNVLLIGGTTYDENGNITGINYGEIFEVAIGKWKQIGSLSSYRNSQSVFQIDEKHIFVGGGDYNNSWEIYNLENHESIYAENFVVQQVIDRSNTIQIKNKNILIIGGFQWYMDGTGILVLEPTKKCWMFDVLTNVNEVENIESNFQLFPNYPNPFNPTTKIKYNLPFNSNVEVTIYDIMGREVKSFNDISNTSGSYELEWNGTNNYGEQVSSGIYLMKFNANSIEGNNKNFTKTMKLMLLK